MKPEEKKREEEDDPDYSPERWRRVTSLPRRIFTDVKETVSDLKEETGEVPYRIQERLNDYFPRRHRVAYPRPDRKP